MSAAGLEDAAEVELEVRGGTTRSRELDLWLAAWEHRMNPVVTAAAIVPIVAGLTQRGDSSPAEWLNFGSWLVFLADLVVHLVCRRRYLRSKIGIFDLTIVVLTAPWYFLPGFGNLRALGLARLARLARVFFASAKSNLLRSLGRRLGRAAVYSIALLFSCALVVEAVEPPSSGFATFWDSMWWAVVTFTTVGYGDLVPVTETGRLAAVLLMVGGIALIGTLAGSLGSFFTTGDEAVGTEGADAAPGLSDDHAQALLDELQALRAEVAELRATVIAGTGAAEP